MTIIMHITVKEAIFRAGIEYSEVNIVSNDEIAGATIWDGASAATNDHFLYVASAAQQFSSKYWPNNLLLVCNPNYDASSIYGGHSLFVAQNLQSLEEICNGLNAAITEHDCWENAILEISIAPPSDGSAIDKLLDYSAEFFHNPIRIFDLSGKLLGSSRIRPRNGALWQESAEIGFIPPYDELPSQIKDIHRLAMQSNDPIAATTSHSSGVFTSKTAAVRMDDTVVAFIAVCEANYVIPPECYPSVMFLAKIAASLLRINFNMSKSDTGIQQLFRDLLNNLPITSEEINQRAFYCNWNIEKHFSIMVIKPLGQDYFPVHLKKYQTQVSHTLNAAISDVFENSIVLLVNCSNSQFKSKNLQQWLDNFLKATNMVMGVSLCSSNPLDIRELFEQAQAATKIGLIIFPDHFRFEYESLQLYDMIDLLKSARTHLSFISKTLQFLKAYDCEHNSDYVSTLQAFYDSNFNQAQAAHALNITRSTMFYRLERIKNITGVDINDSMIMLHFRFSLLLIEYKNKCTGNISV